VYERAFVPGMFGPLAGLVVAAAAPIPGERVLDLACGTGVVARALAPRVGPSGHVTALDLRPGMLAVARVMPPPDGAPVAWIQGDATALDLPSSAFDLVVCQQGLQFFEPRDAALREILRVLRPGGRVVAAVWRSIEHQPLFAGLVEAELRHLAPLGLTRDDALASFLLGDAGELHRLFDEARFTDVRVTEAALETAFAATTFVADVESAYAAVMPAFVDNPAAHARFVSAVERDTAGLVERYRDGEFVRAPMATHIALARRPADAA
jgi:SAM-dependent methyltransferase